MRHSNNTLRETVYPLINVHSRFSPGVLFETFLLRDGVMCADDRRVGIAVCVVLSRLL